MKISNYQVLLIAILAPSLIMFLGVQSTYWFNLNVSDIKIEIASSLIAFSTGIYIFREIKISSKYMLIMAWLIFLSVLPMTIIWVGFSTACGNGNCL